MNRRMLIAILYTLAIAFFALSTTPLFAQDATPNDVDAEDRAYLQEYNQRAVEKYRSMQATQAAKNAASKAASTPEYGGESFLTEYAQRASDTYAASRQPSRPALTQSTPDWGGEMFLAEYGQRSQEKYQQWLASRDGRTVSTK
ncbi:MAG: hypothetical protein KJZ86_16600 [Caldilineaceae bacterium]|nr:hypothetical protein [Caldilineaceae bacterium]